MCEVKRYGMAKKMRGEIERIRVEMECERERKLVRVEGVLRQEESDRQDELS